MKWLKVAFCGLTFAVLAFAQSAPNCNQLGVALTAALPGTSYNNTGPQRCVVWTLTYYAEGFSALSIQLESAPDVAGAPGAWSAISSTFVTNGTNPSTVTTSASLVVNGYFPWVRVNPTSVTGSGFISYSLIGNAYVGPSSSTTMSGSVAASTVNGPDAPGVAPTKNPIQDSGVDGGGLVRRLLTDALGDVLVAGRDAEGAVSTTRPVQMAGLDQSSHVSIPTVEYNAGSGFAAVNIAFMQGGTPGDALSNSLCCRSSDNNNANIPLMANDMGGFDGVNWDRYRTASLANFPTAETLTSRNPTGVRLEEKSSRWSVVSNPAAGSQATASIASEASVRHIVDCVSFSASAGVAPALTALTLNVRDGATGAGTVIWTWTIEISATTGQDVVPHSICGLNLVGTTATAMTAEFSAGLANLSESVSISGFNVN